MKLHMNLTAVILLCGVFAGCVNHRNNESLNINLDNSSLEIDAVGLHFISGTSVNSSKMEVDTLLDIYQGDQSKIFRLARTALENKNYSLDTLTGNAGQDFSILYIKENDTLQFKNGSLKSWTEVKPEFKEIHKILSHYIDLPK
jgi:hypothetical protein